MALAPIFTQSDITHFLNLLGADRVRPAASGEWVHCSCLFKFWRHNNGDQHPSFGVPVSDTPSYMCFGCGKSGLIIDLLLELSYLDPTGMNYPRQNIASALKFIDKYKTDSIDYEGFEWLDKPEPVSKLALSWPEEFLDAFPAIPDHPYLVRRGISEAVARKLDLRYDFKERRIVFPIRNFSGRLVAARGRDVTEEATLRYWPYKYNGGANNNVWLGENTVSFEKPIVLTESVFDFAKIFHVYENVLAPLTASISRSRIERINGAESYITFFDADKAGDIAREKLSKFLTGRVTHIRPSEEFGDAGAMSIECIDDLIKKALKELNSDSLFY